MTATAWQINVWGVLAAYGIASAVFIAVWGVGGLLRYRRRNQKLERRILEQQVYDAKFVEIVRVDSQREHPSSQAE